MSGNSLPIDDKLKERLIWFGHIMRPASQGSILASQSGGNVIGGGQRRHEGYKKMWCSMGRGAGWEGMAKNDSKKPTPNTWDEAMEEECSYYL